MQGTGKMSPVAGLFSEVQDEVLTDSVFEAMVRKDGSVRLGGKAGVGSAVRDGGSLAGGVLSSTGLVGEASGGAAATSPLVANFVRGPAGWSMSPGRRAAAGDGPGESCSPPSRVPPTELMIGGPFNGCNPKCRRVIQSYRHELTELIDSLSEGTKEARLMEEKIADRDKRIKKLRMIVKKILKCRDCGRDVTLNELMC